MKNVFLPNVVIALVRTPRLPPTFAQFSVPLKFNKLDLKNYLQNAYGIFPLSIRSSIRQQAVETVMIGKTRRYKRKQPEKRMTIEMKEPFIWPEDIKDFTKFDKELYTNIEKYRDSMRETQKDMGRGRIEPKIRDRLKESVEGESKPKQQAVAETIKEEVTDIDFDEATSSKPSS